MRNIPGETIWIGHAGDLKNPQALYDLGIEAVVELADSETFATLPRDLIRLRIPLSDGGDNPLWKLKLGAITVAELIRSNISVMLCCSAGMSRSVCIAAGSLSIVRKITLVEALKQVTSHGPADISPMLLEQLRQALT
ncbi:MAG: dual specificity protein phosphatase family protein [Planctomycetia bacterium]|nr:dual specificity protein phosphatase family protein [Planctomycetia bacterium]